MRMERSLGTTLTPNLTSPSPPHFDHLPAIKRRLLSALARVHHGRLHIYLEGHHYLCGESSFQQANNTKIGSYETDTDRQMEAMIRIHKPLKMAWRCVLRGDIGFAESYLAGEWSTDNLSALLTLLLNNRDKIGKQMYGQKLLRSGTRIYHLLRRNHRKGSRKNIQYHYDLGNDFYQHWLDSSMTYSAALFDKTEDLQQAQTNKYQRILDQLGARPGEQILEIGCGWGGFAEAALEAGNSVHGITLSNQQLAFAKDRLQAYGDQAKLEIRDYRDVTQTYDHIVSIEMFEAVGEQYWKQYFEILQRCLKPGGKAVLQIITIDDQLFETYRNRPDFIQRYIFPGGMLPSEEKLQQHVDNTELRCIDKFSFGKDYARTLAEWHQNFVDTLPELRKLGYDDRFERMWRYYLSYCEAGFLENRINVVQWTLQKK